MTLLIFSELSTGIRLYLILVTIAAPICLLGLFLALKRIVNRQVESQIEKFAIEAKIPKVFVERIGKRIKWR